MNKVIKMVDLIFTQDPEWQEAREKQWKPIEKDLKTDFSKKDLEPIKFYFMTGLLPEGKALSDGALLHYFPLKTPEGWDFVLENLASSSDFLKDAITANFHDLTDYGFSEEELLSHWDYFLGDSFKPQYKPRVPVDGHTNIRIGLSAVECFNHISATVWAFLTGGVGDEKTIVIQKTDYFYSLWPEIKNEDFESDDDYSIESNCIFIINSYFKQIVDFSPRVEFDDPNQTRPKFLKMMEEKLDELYPQLCPKLQALWDETKAKKAALAK